MVERMMYLAIGFLIASLIGVVFIPYVYDRAVRLTMWRLKAGTAASMATIQAEKDQFEFTIEHLKAKVTSQLAEIGERANALSRLKAELGEKTATIRAMEASEKALKEQLRATEEERRLRAHAFEEAERTIADKEAELVRLVAEIDQRSRAAHVQRAELLTLRTQMDALKVQIDDKERELQEACLAQQARQSVTIAGAEPQPAIRQEPRFSVETMACVRQAAQLIEMQRGLTTDDAAERAELLRQSTLLRKRMNELRLRSRR